MNAHCHIQLSSTSYASDLLSMTKPQEFTIQVQSEDPKKKDKPLNDKLLKSNAEPYCPTLETLHILIRTSTLSMTSVPKPLKLLQPHYIDIQAQYETWSPSEDKVSSSASLKIF